MAKQRIVTTHAIKDSQGNVISEERHTQEVSNVCGPVCKTVKTVGAIGLLGVALAVASRGRK